jgi:hypothetical protein
MKEFQDMRHGLHESVPHWLHVVFDLVGRKVHGLAMQSALDLNEGIRWHYEKNCTRPE